MPVAPEQDVAEEEGVGGTLVQTFLQPVENCRGGAGEAAERGVGVAETVTQSVMRLVLD